MANWYRYVKQNVQVGKPKLKNRLQKHLVKKPVEPIEKINSDNNNIKGETKSHIEKPKSSILEIRISIIKTNNKISELKLTMR